MPDIPFFVSHAVYHLLPPLSGVLLRVGCRGHVLPVQEVHPQLHLLAGHHHPHASRGMHSLFCAWLLHLPWNRQAVSLFTSLCGLALEPLGCAAQRQRHAVRDAAHGRSLRGEISLGLSASRRRPPHSRSAHPRLSPPRARSWRPTSSASRWAARSRATSSRRRRTWVATWR